jgi:hypothetical protein
MRQAAADKQTVVRARLERSTLRFSGVTHAQWSPSPRRGGSVGW